MFENSQNLPDEVDPLKKIILAQQTRIEDLQSLNTILFEQIRILRAKRFGRSSEKHKFDHPSLFNEAELEALSNPGGETEKPDDSEKVDVAAHSRTKKKRKPLPPDLPREDVLHDLPESEKICGVDGSKMVEIGQEISEQLDIVPAQFKVIRHIRIKYGCPHCHKGVKTAPLSPQPIPKSQASPGLLAYIIIAKFLDGLPLYRLESILQRAGMSLPRSTLSHWVIKMGAMVQILINLMQDLALDSGYIRMDETTVQVLKEPNKKATSKSYMWVWITGPPTDPIILFHYNQSRAKEVPDQLLDGFQGYLQADGYGGYNLVGARPGIILLGCWSHVRRKFDEAIKALGNGAHKKTGKAHQGLAFIQQLYQIERKAKEMSPDERFAFRQKHAPEILSQLKEWLDHYILTVPPKSALGKAMGYLAGQWKNLIRYLEDGRLEMDNNLVENAIRPFVVGRKGWLFCDSVAGAKASANLYSLVETAKANGHDPYRYLRHIFKELPKAQSIEDYEALLPMNLSPDSLS